MTDNLTTEFILGGTDDDIKAMLKVARSSFEKSGSEYSFQLGHIKDLDIDDLLVQRDGKGNIKIEAMGPFGKFEPTLDLDIFKKMADAAPNGYFKVTIDGDITYSEHHAVAELKDGTLTFHSSYYNYDDSAAKIRDILAEETEYDEDEDDYSGFKEMFKISSTDDEDEDDDLELEDIFDDFVSALDSSLFEYEDFTDLLDEYDAKTSLSDESFMDLLDGIGLADADAIRDEVSTDTDYEYHPNR